MKRIVTETVLSVILYTLIAVAISSVYLPFADLAETLRENPDGFEITINLIPWIILVLFGTLHMIYSFKARNKNKSFFTWAFKSMTEYAEGDEREANITNKATRSAYTTYGITIPIFMIFLLFYPLLSSTFPTYPIYLLAAIINISTIVYGVTWVREYRK